jgi:PEP-CTERM motif
MQILKVCLATFAFLCPVFGSPLFVVVPNAEESTVGNAPGPPGTATNLHFQEIFAADQFAGIPGPLLISQYSYRAVPETGPVSVSTTSMTISASTSPYWPNSSGSNTLITNTFADNIGPDNTLVFSGSGTLSSPGCTGVATCPFDLVITFDTPFFYDPALGSLLLDVQIASTTGSGTVDLQSFTFPPGGSEGILGGNIGDATGSFASIGQVIQFGYTLTPEPSTSTLMLSGLAGCLALFRFRNRRRA